MYRALIQLLIFQFRIIRTLFKSKDDLVLETIELRQQLMTYQVLSVREDALNRMVIFNEKQLYDLMKQYVEYYNNDRCHLSVDRDSPNGREIQNKPFGSARVISLPRIGDLHHLYKWDKAA